MFKPSNMFSRWSIEGVNYWFYGGYSLLMFTWLNITLICWGWDKYTLLKIVYNDLFIGILHTYGGLLSVHIWQGSHRVWKTGKTGKKIMVREKSGKSQGILFWAKSQGKVREFCFKLLIAMKLCCYSCRLSRMFVTVFTNMKVHMWILKNFCILHGFQVLHQQH